MLDPLQNILHCADMVLLAREKQAAGEWLAMIGEMDHVCEIQRQVKELSMANFVSLLKHLGHYATIGLEGILKVALAAEPFVAIAAPEIAPLFIVTVGVVVQAEQKWHAIGAGKSGPKKLAEATSILGPLITQVFTAAGRPVDAATIAKYVDAVVKLLNGLPAPGLPFSVPLEMVTNLERSGEAAQAEAIAGAQTGG